jgi:hypothetical protein
MRRFLLALVVCLSASVAVAADWQPAKGPLMTRWAEDVKADKPLPEYPRPLLERKDWLNLNGVWQFAMAKQDEAAPLGKDLEGKILVPFPVESALSGVMKPADRVWYRRTFAVPKDWVGKRVLLHFGAVNWDAKVWVNGKEVASHQGGYDGFSADITEVLKKEGEQELVVGVWNPIDAGPQPRGKQVRKPGGIMYTACSGIWQTVWLEPVPENHIQRIDIVPDIDKGEARLTVVLPRAAAEAEIQAALTVDGKVIASERTKAKDRENVLTLKIPADQLKLWSPEQPFLYDLTVAVGADAVHGHVGMRKTSLGKDDKGITRPFLNNKPYFQVGPLDQGFWPDGIYTAPTDAALKYDIEVTKQLGFNMVRKHVKVEPERWYYWCDKLGLLVWQDMPSGDAGVGPGKGEMKRTPESAKIYERELKAMIDGRRNHPCIVMWVVFNEGWGQFDTVRVTEWTKKYDPSRLVNGASGWNDMKCGDVHDLHVYPGPGSPQPEENRAAVLGEFGGLGLQTKGHMWSDKHWGYAGTNDKAELTRKYEKLLRQVYELKEKPGLSAAVYTQTTDVETEANGLLTYDRAVIKVELERVAAVNRGDFSRVPDMQVVIPTSQKEGLAWRFTTEKPADAWFKSDFDDGTWKEAPGGFGTRGAPGAVVRTEWKTDDIWIRRSFTLPDGKLVDPHLLMHHDEDAEIYINGVLAAKVHGFTKSYEEVAISPEARATLKPGKNLIAVHCHQTVGGQYIDVGIVDNRPAKR